MLAQLIQALYNIVDSLFVGRYSGSGLTALSIIYPLQLLMIALAVGTGVGINTVMAAELGTGRQDRAETCAGVGTPLAAGLWLVFAAACWVVLPGYARISTHAEAVIRDVVTYGRIVCVCSFGLFLESVWTKILQARGYMTTPMIAQILGAVTALGLYYKWQTFFFIPLGAMQTCIVPVISFNYAARKIARCRQTLATAVGFGLALMAVGAFFFLTVPGPPTTGTSRASGGATPGTTP